MMRLIFALALVASALAVDSDRAKMHNRAKHHGNARVSNITETVAQGNETAEWMTDPYVDTIAAANIAMQARNIEEHGAGMLSALELVADSQTEQKQQQINVKFSLFK